MDYQSIYTSPPVIEKILEAEDETFFDTALQIFHYQYQYNSIYAKWVNALRRDISKITAIHHFPFLPIAFFKTHRVSISDTASEIIFSSSGTTGSQTSKHYVYCAAYYTKSFMAAFRSFYGDPAEWAIIGLLPSYLERAGSSLVWMTEQLIQASDCADSGLFLHDFESLQKILERREAAGQKTWLIGVTYALLDFAARCPMQLNHTVIIETGGMKGRKKEMTRMEVHAYLKQAFHLPAVHSEYGMTELLSQAYALKNGLFRCPPWMKALVRLQDDPFAIAPSGVGALCVIDLANVHSSSFIATDDIAKVYADGTFEILGRMDNSDIRGCSLLSL